MSVKSTYQVVLLFRRGAGRARGTTKANLATGASLTRRTPPATDFGGNARGHPASAPAFSSRSATALARPRPALDPVSCGSASGVARGLDGFRFGSGSVAARVPAAVATTDAGDVTLAPQMEQKRAVSGRAQ